MCTLEVHDFHVDIARCSVDTVASGHRFTSSKGRVDIVMAFTATSRKAFVSIVNLLDTKCLQP